VPRRPHHRRGKDCRRRRLLHFPVSGLIGRRPRCTLSPIFPHPQKLWFQRLSLLMVATAAVLGHGLLGIRVSSTLGACANYFRIVVGYFLTKFCSNLSRSVLPEYSSDSFRCGVN
jgi:hypothetical protein